MPGVRMATCAAGVRYRGRDDLALMVFDQGTVVAGSFTRSQTAGAPVIWSRRVAKCGVARALIVNAGNANVFTGEAGHATVLAEAEAVSNSLGLSVDDVLVCSTGVIGEPLDPSSITRHVPRLTESLRPDAWLSFAEAIRTTDTYPKVATVETKLQRGMVRLNGLAKGSGMIAPNMATMLAFLATDAAISPALLKQMLKECVDETFNCITVDGDTSTSDSVLLAATGKVGDQIVRTDDPDYVPFRDALLELCRNLALQVVCDGEGLTKLVEIRLRGATSRETARTLAMAVANSPLLKTAIAGGDANWGRIVMALGKAGPFLNVADLRIAIGNHPVASNGVRDAAYDEDAVSRHVAGARVEIDVSVGPGPGEIKVWTTDMTNEFVAINASYRS